MHIKASYAAPSGLKGLKDLKLKQGSLLQSRKRGVGFMDLVKNGKGGDHRVLHRPSAGVRKSAVGHLSKKFDKETQTVWTTTSV